MYLSKAWCNRGPTAVDYTAIASTQEKLEVREAKSEVSYMEVGGYVAIKV